MFQKIHYFLQIKLIFLCREDLWVRLCLIHFFGWGEGRCPWAILIDPLTKTMVSLSCMMLQGSVVDLLECLLLKLMLHFSRWNRSGARKSNKLGGSFSIAQMKFRKELVSFLGLYPWREMLWECLAMAKDLCLVSAVRRVELFWIDIWRWAWVKILRMMIRSDDPLRGHRNWIVVWRTRRDMYIFFLAMSIFTRRGVAEIFLFHLLIPRMAFHNYSFLQLCVWMI